MADKGDTITIEWLRGHKWLKPDLGQHIMYQPRYITVMGKRHHFGPSVPAIKYNSGVLFWWG